MIGHDVRPDGSVREYVEMTLDQLSRKARRAFQAAKRRGATDDEAMEAANAAHVGKGKR